MNQSIGGGRMPQPQKLQASASGHSRSVDPELERMRKAMYWEIVRYLETVTTVPKHKVPALALRFEAAMFKQHPSKVDYYNKLKEPIDQHLRHALMTTMALKKITSSGTGTVIPTPDMACSVSGNSRMPNMMDNTCGNSTTGSVSNRYQHTPTNFPLNFANNGVSSGMGYVDIQHEMSTTSESFTNLSPYAGLCKNPLQPQFNHSSSQRTPSRFNLDMGHVNFLSNSRMNYGSFTCPATMQSVQLQTHIEVDNDKRAHISRELSNSQTFHFSAFNDFQQLFPQHQQFDDSSTGFKQDAINLENYHDQTWWLLMLFHAKACPSPIGRCKFQHCVDAQKVLKHFMHCQIKNCSFKYCQKSKSVIFHYKNCVDKHCPVCSTAKKMLGLSSELVHKHSPLEPISIMQQNMIKNFTDGVHDDRVDIDMVRVETFDGQLSAPKRLRSQLKCPNASDNTISFVSMPQTNQGSQLQKDNIRQLEENNSVVQKQEVNAGIHIQPIEKPTNDLAIICYDTDEKIKQRSLANETMNENVIDVENKTNGSTTITMPKLGKPKIKGVSLMEFFTPEQIEDHINSLRQWVGKSKVKTESNQAIGYLENDSLCQLCNVVKLNFEPPPIYCSPCGARIKRNALYYIGSTNETRHYFCALCYNESRGHKIEVDGSHFLKSKLKKRKNDDEQEEGWVQCDKCKCWQHQICALFNARRNDGGEAEYTCHNCYVQEIRNGLRVPLPQGAILGARDLPRTLLSDYIEDRLFKRLRDERQARANLFQKSFYEVPGADGLVIRVVSLVDKKLEVKPRFFEIFQEYNYAAEFPYKSKAILLFQKIEGVEVCLFGMFVQEFGSECAFPNQRQVYLSYIDSVKYFRPEIKTVSGEALRTVVYHEILIGYLDYCKQRGFTSCYIWACPPLKGEDYILYCHPEIQKTPKSDKLREWYLSMLQKASKEHIVVELTNLYDHFFVTTKECKAKVTAARLPYFDGDYWPGAAEDMINQLRLEEDGGKLQRGKIKRISTKRALKAADHTDLSGNASKDAMLMQKLGEIICPMKEDFIMVHLQYSCSHCSILMVSGRRWVCEQCKGFYICDKCYDAEQRLEENERHPSNIRRSHTLHPVEIVGVPEHTKDEDNILECEIFDNRQAFLSLCQGNHYQYDTLRRAKHSSMMLLYHLHDPRAPAFVTTCNVCNHDIETGGQGWRCEECPDFDVCDTCYQKDGSASHHHRLTKPPSSAVRNAQTKEAQQKRAQQAQTMLKLLVHVSACHVSHCQYTDCRRVKALFHHGVHCKTRAAGGCERCKKMWFLIQFHARACKESNCTMPRCRDIKDHLRRLQQQSDYRRRAAVNEMMRQRAEEVAANH